jgi:hypothetical protein
LTNVVAHGVPYYALVWLYGRRKWRDGSWRQAWHRPVGLVFFVGLLLALAYLEEGVWDLLVWKEHAAAYLGFAVDWTLTSAAAAALVPLLALPQAVHYLLDAWIWRFDGSNPRIGELLLGLPNTREKAIISRTP